MRTTWIILAFMILTGIAMYYLANRKREPGPYDSISLSDTSSQAITKTRVYLAQNAVHVYYNDTTGWMQDSVPLKKILDGSALNFFSKKYHSVALFITYENRYFFDLEINKPDSNLAYDVSLKVQPMKDSFYVQGTIDTNEDSVLRFSGPMIKMYKEFMVTYIYKLPPGEIDSALLPEEGPMPTKTISILSK